ncbi:serine/threonine protein kinase [Arthrobacter sp. UYEF6]
MEQDRWIEVSDSQFPHEIEGLAYLKSKIPAQSPYRVWSNFEFRDGRGGWHEVDALLLGRGGLHLLELKYYSGRLTGSDTQWLRDGRRAEPSPLLLARRKAQYLASKLKDALADWAREKGIGFEEVRGLVPFVGQAVFLHHPRFVSELPASSALGLYGLDEEATSSHLPGISDLIGQEPRANAAIGQNQEAILVDLMARIGLVQRREREAGSWIIEDGALDEGPGWQDWSGYHKVSKQETVRIRFQITPPGTSQSVASRNYKIAEHEFRLMSRLSHDGLLRPRDLVDSELGVGLVYDYSDGMQRLDLWLAGQPNGLPLDQRLSIIRQLAEALDYAHRNQVVHRGLSPKAVWIKAIHGQPKVLIGDWQSAGLASGQVLTGHAADGVTSLLDRRPDPNQADAWLTEAFEAPEGRWQPESADRIRVDVFSLGALAYFILASQRPADSSLVLAERLRNQRGLDLSLELPSISPSIREAVLGATRPAPGERFDGVGKFLDALFGSPPPSSMTGEEIDAVDAVPGAALADGRFTVLRRLGRGSTAVGLLVKDADDAGAQRVLKVAVDSKAAHRLHEEAAVLRALSGPRLVKILDGPLSLGDRSALLLESAGEQTLSELLRERKRLSLDLLERLGRDLLEALVQLDKDGVDHRDIKPGNLGVRAERSGKHLVLFDFSLSRAAASDIAAGTPPYLDPFLGGLRSRFDSAAERYSAAVVLFEMATGHTPFYGDPLAHPSSVPNEATIEAHDFDRAVAPRLVSFFRTALARDAKRRYDTATEMLENWRAAFPTDATTAPENSDELAAVATQATPLEQSGLSARALSALEPLGVSTVGELTAVDPVRLNALRGVAHATKREVSTRAVAWRQKFGDKAKQGTAGTALLPSVLALAERLIEAAGTRKAVQSRAAAGLILGTYGDVDAFATQAQLGAHLPNPVTAAGANQLVGKLQTAWAEDQPVLGFLRHLSTVVNQRLNALGGAATIDELAMEVLAQTTVESERTGENERIARGLLRIVVDRQRALKRADSNDEPLELRRRDGNAMLLARETPLLDAAERLGREADSLLAESTAQPAVVPAERVHQRLTAFLDAAGIEDALLRDRVRLARLAAGLSRQAAASGSGELHDRDLSQIEALGLALRGVAGPQRLSPREIVDRVRVRFPAVPALPTSGRLAELLREAGLELAHDPASGTYGIPTIAELSQASSSRLATGTHTGGLFASESTPESRLRDSITQRSFLALGARADLCDTLAVRLETEFHAQRIDVTALLLDELKSLSLEAGFPSWEALVRADAQPENDRATRGVAAAVMRAVPVVEAAISAAAADTGQDPRPVVIVEASPLARYGRADILRHWSDLATGRGQAVWVILPQVGASRGPLLDGASVQTSPNQYLRVDTAWIDAPTNRIPAAAEGATL